MDSPLMDMKRFLHKKYGWFKCRFSPLDAYNEVLECRWCGKKYKRDGIPYIGGMTLTRIYK